MVKNSMVSESDFEKRGLMINEWLINLQVP